MRKFNCWNISIVPQYARFKESRLRSAVFGNSRQFILMRQTPHASALDTGICAAHAPRLEHEPLAFISNQHRIRP